MIKKSLHVLFSKLANRLRPNTQQELRNKYCKIDQSTILLDGLKLRTDKPISQRTLIQIGEKGLINANFIFETETGKIEIGNNVHIGGATFICKSAITIKNDVTMAWGITLYDHDSHSTNWEHRKHDNLQCYSDYVNHNGNNVTNKDWTNVKTAPITVNSKVWIGFDVLILKGVTIGEGAVVAAKSVVTKDVPPYTLVAGNPAKTVRELPQPQ